MWAMRNVNGLGVLSGNREQMSRIAVGWNGREHLVAQSEIPCVCKIVRNVRLNLLGERKIGAIAVTVDDKIEGILLPTVDCDARRLWSVVRIARILIFAVYERNYLPGGYGCGSCPVSARKRAEQVVEGAVLASEQNNVLNLSNVFWLSLLSPSFRQTHAEEQSYNKNPNRQSSCLVCRAATLKNVSNVR